MPSSQTPSVDDFFPSPRQAKRSSIAGQCAFVLIIVSTSIFQAKWFLRIADFHRLMCTCLNEFPDSSPHARTHVNSSNHAYQEALANAKELSPMDPVRLTVSYSFATFTRDVLKSSNKAHSILRHAIEDAAAYATARPHEEFSPESRKEIQRLREKLESWRNTASP